MKPPRGFLSGLKAAPQPGGSKVETGKGQKGLEKMVFISKEDVSLYFSTPTQTLWRNLGMREI